MKADEIVSLVDTLIAECNQRIDDDLSAFHSVWLCDDTKIVSTLRYWRYRLAGYQELKNRIAMIQSHEKWQSEHQEFR